MTEKEYDDALKELEDEFKKKKKELNLKYTVANRKYKTGDVIKNEYCKIKVTGIYSAFTFGSKYPEAKYYGRVLKKDGTPTKKEMYDTIYQSQIIE